MATEINKKSYIKLVKEDLDWLENQPYSLEQSHIKAILKCSICRIYGGENPLCDLVKCKRYNSK